MKRNIKFNLFGWFAVAAMFLMASCQRDPLIDETFDDSENGIVTFSIFPETTQGQTRAVVYPGQNEYPHISDGSKADVLIYAVYDEEGVLLEEYGQGRAENDGLPAHIKAGPGQTVMNVAKEGNGEFPVAITLKMKRGKTYTIAFWAQSSKCKAYDTEDLTKVRIIYEELDGEENSTPNNDELRDAFCKNEVMTLSSKADENRTVLLYRPLAQINVGTTGYDYETVVQDEKQQYAYTRSQIITAARYLNVVTDKIETADENKPQTDLHSALDFTYSRIPAYINYTDEEFSQLNLMDIDQTGKEEFLKVKLFSDSETGEDYMPIPEGGKFRSYARLADEGKKTETFKYLSMCYVLVASEEGYSGSIDNVNVWIATDPENPEESEIQIVDLTNVPARRNWRTNIVGNILTESVPFKVVLDPIYSGDYNGWYADGTTEWSGPLADGAYYDAEADEILISNVNGLIWLQQMVNGKLIYRECNSSYRQNVGDTYKDTYFDAMDSEKNFADAYGQSYIEMPADAQLAARIMKATHQDRNPYRPSANNGWPTNGNFHFMGMNGSVVDPARVKLVADIDLSGIEWLPIGFDCALWDNSMRSTIDVIKNEYGMNNVPGSAQTRRAFCGEFDGNGHTISNIKNMRFSAEVLPVACQDDNYGPYDNPQWFPAGLFGQLAGNAYIHDLRVSNLDLYGYHTGGGIAGTANGNNIVVERCTVDGGTLILSPMHRGDSHKEDRTFARGIYAGGVIGYYNASGKISNCTVQNMELRAYRNIGGILGTDGYSLGSSNGQLKAVAQVEGNTVNNVIIIADKFKPYDFFFSSDNYGGGVYKNGYGWNQSQLALSGDVVGGSNPAGLSGNNVYNVVRTEFSTMIEDKNSKTRSATIQNVPLSYLPMLSSLFCDELTLKAHFSGKPSAFKRFNVHEFDLKEVHDGNSTTFKVNVATKAKIFPFNLPTELDVDFDRSSGSVGMYVESVLLEGKQDASHGYSKLTVEDETGENDCAMFITSRNLTPFTKWLAKQSTTVNNMIVRGLPYAYTGICLAPNEFTKSITLDNVSVYDVFQTLALDKSVENEGVWPNRVSAEGVDLLVKNSNLRGYTVPGSGWNSVNYSEVVFERGAVIKEVDESLISTCKVEATTTFNKCMFKAPFTIVIAENTSVKFTGCRISFGLSEDDLVVPDNCTKVEINSAGEVNFTVSGE